MGAARDAIHLAAKAWGSPALKNMNLHMTKPVSRSDAGTSPAARVDDPGHSGGAHLGSSRQKCSSGPTIAAILALLNTDATRVPKASSESENASSSTCTITKSIT